MKILSFPELRQSFEYDCGANALQSVLAYYGIDVSEENLMKQVQTTKSGTKVDKIKKTAIKYGLKVELAEMTTSQIVEYIKKKIPVIMLLQAWSGYSKYNYQSDFNNGHYVVAIGYDKNNIYFEDPYSILRTYLNFTELEKRWHDKRRVGKISKNVGLAIYGKKSHYNLNRAIPMG